MRRFWHSITKPYGQWSKEYEPVQANVAHFLDLLLESDDVVRDVIKCDYDHVGISDTDWRKIHKNIDLHAKFMQKLFKEKRAGIFLSQILVAMEDHIRAIRNAKVASKTKRSNKDTH